MVGVGGTVVSALLHPGSNRNCGFLALLVSRIVGPSRRISIDTRYVQVYSTSRSIPDPPGYHLRSSSSQSYVLLD